MRLSGEWIDAHIGDKIRRTRVLRDIGLGELAAAIRLTVREMKARETGVVRISPIELADIAGFLKVDLDFLFGGLPSAPFAAPGTPSLRVVASNAASRANVPARPRTAGLSLAVDNGGGA